MEEKNYTGLIPPQDTGVVINSTASKNFDEIAEAKAFFQLAKTRLVHVNDWHKLIGAGAEFQLVDINGNEVNRPVKKGDYFKIDIPGPVSSAGKGYDWVQVEDLKEVSIMPDVDSVGLRVRPSKNPLSTDESVAHFYSKDSTSTFIVTREDKKITATIYDRNTKPNTESETIMDKVRHVATGIGAILGGSKLQWKGLAEGLVKVGS